MPDQAVAQGFTGLEGSNLDTRVITVDPSSPDAEAIRQAADVLRAGGLVAFPTETVYGLDANALDPSAVARIFEAKGRPPSNPIIVHVSDPEKLSTVAAEWPGVAHALVDRFWPGPLTLVVQKKPEVPDIVTAGGPTVAVRCPAHPVARMLIREAGVPVAAPSANRSTELSPTRVEHVLKGLNGRIDLVLDGGPCPGGIESTVVDVTAQPVRLLRPGLISVPMLEAVVGTVESTDMAAERPGEVPRSPGQMPRHYAPRTPLLLVPPGQIVERALEAAGRGAATGVVAFSPADLDVSRAAGPIAQLPADPDRAASQLYDTLHFLDNAGLDLIVVELPPDRPEWAAIRDRLFRAAHT